MASYEKSLKDIFEKADNDLKRIEAENIIKHFRSKRKRAHSPATDDWSNLPGASLDNDLNRVFENKQKAKKSRKGGKSRKNRKSRKRHN